MNKALISGISIVLGITIFISAVFFVPKIFKKDDFSNEADGTVKVADKATKPQKTTEKNSFEIVEISGDETTVNAVTTTPPRISRRYYLRMIMLLLRLTQKKTVK